MVNVIFYDKKNKREISSNDLMGTRVTTEIVYGDTEGGTGEDDAIEYNSGRHKLYIERQLIGDLCYRTKDCPKESNWDKYLMENDLIFLRIE